MSSAFFPDIAPCQLAMTQIFEMPPSLFSYTMKGIQLVSLLQ